MMPNATRDMESTRWSHVTGDYILLDGASLADSGYLCVSAKFEARFLRRNARVVQKMYEIGSKKVNYNSTWKKQVSV